MKKNILFRTGAVCKLALLLFAALIMTACDNGEDPDPIVIPPDEEDTRVKEVWVKNRYANSGEVYHSLTLIFYPEEEYFYVKQEPFIYSMYHFGDDYDIFYDIRNDTMYLRYPDEAEFDYGRPHSKYLIVKYTSDTLKMDYIGGGTHDKIFNYLFTRQN